MAGGGSSRLADPVVTKNDAEDEVELGFVPATQHEKVSHKQSQKDLQQKLAALKSWDHGPSI